MFSLGVSINSVRIFMLCEMAHGTPFKTPVENNCSVLKDTSSAVCYASVRLIGSWCKFDKIAVKRLATWVKIPLFTTVGVDSKFPRHSQRKLTLCSQQQQTQYCLCHCTLLRQLLVIEWNECWVVVVNPPCVWLFTTSLVDLYDLQCTYIYWGTTRLY